MFPRSIRWGCCQQDPLQRGLDYVSKSTIYSMYDCKTACLSREEDAKSLVNG